MYDYVENKELRFQLIDFSETAIVTIQKALKDYFTFSYKLIGSGDYRLMMINGKNNSIDLDYNFVIQRDKQQLIGNPEVIKKLFMTALKQYFANNVKVSDKTQVIKCKIGEFCGYDFSIDIAIMFEGNNGSMYKIINDKNTVPSKYIWNEVRKSKDFEYKFLTLKRFGLWKDIKDLYKKKKNYNLQLKIDKQSFSVLIETVNEIIQRNHIEL